MSKLANAIKLSNLTGGLNRFVADARPDQCIDALDVYEDQGELVRRPAYVPYGITAPYHLPAGKVTVVREDPLLTTWTQETTRAFTLGYNKISGSSGRLWIGCEEPFDGLWWGNVSSTPSESNVTNNACVAIGYLRGVDSILASGVFDTTKKRLVNGTSHYKQALWRNGYIVWDRNSFNGWTATTLSGTSVGGTLYWVQIALSLKEYRSSDSSGGYSGTAFPVSSGNIVIAAPGVQAVLMNPVNGLRKTRVGGRAPVIISGADFATKRTYGPGGGLGFTKCFDEAPEIASLVEDEGSGILGVYARPNWAGTTTNKGTTVALTKSDLTYNWSIGQFAEFELEESFIPASTGTVNYFDVLTSALPRFDSNNSHYYEKCIVRCTYRVASGPAVNEERQIWKIETVGGNYRIYVYDAFTDAPVVANVFSILSIPSRVKTTTGIIDYGLRSNDANVATLAYTTRPYNTPTGLADYNLPVNFEIGKTCFDVLNAGKHWCFMYDPVTDRTLIANGRNGLFEYDGTRLRRLEAMFSEDAGDPGADLVSTWRGVTRDLAAELNDPQVAEGSPVLHTPPDGEFICDYNNRIVVAGGQKIRYSAPGIYNAIWPFVYTANIRDVNNDPITGMRVIGDRLAVFTQSSVHLGGPITDRGEIPFTPAVQGIGFVSHYAVDSVSYENRSVIMGITPDGISATDGAQIFPVVDDWRRLLPYGVNAQLLNKAVAATWKQRDLFIACVPSAGSDKNDRVVVINYVDKKAWLWTAPNVLDEANDETAAGNVRTFAGITSITSVLDDAGQEQILFGLDNGFIVTLAEGLLDFNRVAPLGRAKSKPIEFDDRTIAAKAIMLHMSAVGTAIIYPQNATEDGNSTLNLTAKLYFNKRKRDMQEGAITLDSVSDDGIYGTTYYSEHTTGIGYYAEEQSRTYRLPITTGLGRGEWFSYELVCGARFRFSGADLLFALKGQKGF